MSGNQLNSFGERLSLAAEMLELTYRDIAEKTGINENTLYRIKNEDRTPSFDTLQTIKNHYPLINLDFLIIGKGPVILDPKYVQSLKLDYSMENEPKKPFKSGSSDNVSSKVIRDLDHTLKEMLEFFKANTPIKS